MPIRLLVKSKAETGERPPQEVVLQGEAVVLGRDKVCEVVLNDQVVSRRHAQVLREGALYFLEDMGSSFGTRINGTPLPAGEKRLLKNGDVIAIGPFDVTFDRLPDAAASPEEKTSYVAKRVVKDALRGLGSGGAIPYLRVMNGPLEGKRFEVDDAQELIIGREETVDVMLDEDDLVSRRHAKVRRDWSGTAVEDLGSRNGIKVNRQKVLSSPLKDRDEIEVGNTRFLFLDPSEVREAPVVREERPKSKPSHPAAVPKSEPAAAAAVPPVDDEPEEKSQVDEPAPAPPKKKPEPEPADENSSVSSVSSVSEVSGVSEVSQPGAGGESSVAQPLPAPSSPPQAAQSVVGPLPGGIWQRYLPLIIVGGIALFALGILIVTFVVM